MVRHRSSLTALVLAASVAAVSLFAAGCGNRNTEAAASDQGSLPVVTVGCDTYAPFSYIDVDGNLTGIDVELAQEAFGRLGYHPEFTIINWEEKKTLLKDGTINCIWSSFTMDGREDEYKWAGPYMKSNQVIAVNTDSEIKSLQDLAGKAIAVQSTTKPEDLLRAHDSRIGELRKVISVQKRDLIFALLSKGYVDAIAAHDTAIGEFMSETGMEFRILEEPLLTVGLGVAFDVDDESGLNERLSETLEEMKADGTTRQILEKYVSDAEHYLGE